MTDRPDHRLRLDLNNPVFQQQLFALERQAQVRVLATLRRLATMTWQDLYRDRGLRWELIHSRAGPNGARLYSFRISQGFRGVAYRDDHWLRLLTLHPDHDSTY